MISRRKGATQKKHQTCQNQIRCLSQNDPLFYIIISYSFFIQFEWSKELWVHQVKLYYSSLSFKCKEPVEKNHKKHKCTKLECVNFKPMTEHLPHLLSMPILFSFFIYFEGESMLNVLGSLLVKLTKGRTKTHHKIIIHAIFLVEWLLIRYFFIIMHLFKISHYKSKF